MIYETGIQVEYYLNEDMKKHGNQELHIDYTEIDYK